MSEIPAKYRAVILVSGVILGLTAILLLSVALMNDGSRFDSDRFKNNPDETRLAMYKSLKAKNLNGWSREQVIELLGEPALGLTENNVWTYPMGHEGENNVELVLSFRKDKLKKIEKLKAENDF